jgi:hypothetical protein
MVEDILSMCLWNCILLKVCKNEQINLKNAMPYDILVWFILDHTYATCEFENKIILNYQRVSCVMQCAWVKIN